MKRLEILLPDVIPGLVLAEYGRAQPAVFTGPSRLPEPTPVAFGRESKRQPTVIVAIDTIDSMGFHVTADDLTQLASLYRAVHAPGMLTAQDIIKGSGFDGKSEAIAEEATFEGSTPHGQVKSEVEWTA